MRALIVSLLLTFGGAGSSAGPAGTGGGSVADACPFNGPANGAARPAT